MRAELPSNSAFRTCAVGGDDVPTLGRKEFGGRPAKAVEVPVIKTVCFIKVVSSFQLASYGATARFGREENAVSGGLGTRKAENDATGFPL